MSNRVLTSTYKPILKDSIMKNLGILLICADNQLLFEDIDSVFTKLDLMSYNKFVTSGKSVFYRDNMKQFIESSFVGYEKVNLKDAFGVPITLLVDSNLNILHTEYFQDIESIKKDIYNRSK